MSVIFDALRRARQRSDAAAAAQSRVSTAPRAHVPSGLGLTPTPMAVRSSRAWWLIPIVVAAVALAAWLAIDRDPVVQPAHPTPTVNRETPPRAPSTPPTPSTPAPESESAVASLDQPGRLVPPRNDVPGGASRMTATQRASHFANAVRLHNAGKLDEAAKEYMAAIAENDRHVEARNNLGLLYRARGRTIEAVEQFRRALAIDPRYVKARNHLAVILIDAGRLPDARDEITAALAIDPRNADLLVNLALIERANGHPDRAVELLLRALGERPAHAAAHYNLGLLYDERRAFTLAYSHYVEFLTYAGPEYDVAVIAEVRRRAETLGKQVGAPASK